MYDKRIIKHSSLRRFKSSATAKEQLISLIIKDCHTTSEAGHDVKILTQRLREWLGAADELFDNRDKGYHDYTMLLFPKENPVHENLKES